MFSRTIIQSARLGLLAVPIALGLGHATAAIVSISTGGAVVAVRANNLVTNGSFENRLAGDPAISTNVNWSGVMGQHITATQGTGAVYAIPGWTQTSSPGAYGIWGPLTATGVAAPPCTHGAACVYFGNYFTGTGASNPAIFHPDGRVTYATPPVFTNISSINSAPTTLSQTLTGLVVGDEYLLDFWAAGEDSTLRFTQPGVFGLDIGADSVFLTAPSLTSLLAATSIRYQVVFKATATSEVLKFTNWGHITTTSTELVLDDVIVNRVSEPAGITLIALAIIILGATRRATSRRASVVEA